MMKQTGKVDFSIKRIVSCFKDWRFSSILIKYFLLLLICLVLPVTALTVWYGKQMKKNLEEEMMKHNEASLEQAYNHVESLVRSVKNLAYSLSQDSGILYLTTRDDLKIKNTGNLDELRNMLAITKSANDYIESMCVYFRKSDTFVTNQGSFKPEEYSDNECLELYSDELSNRIVYQARKLNGKYPYLLTILCPISDGKASNAGAVIININVERLGNYIGSGRYRNIDEAPILLIYDEPMETLIYSDEYRLLAKEQELTLEITNDWEDSFSKVCMFEDRKYIVSGIVSEQNGFRYLYLTSMHQFEQKNQASNQLLRNSTLLMGVVCLILASILAVWVYKPIQKTIHVLKDMSMLTEWDHKEHIDEIEAIQRSILSAKKTQENLDEQIQERIICLRNAQICALQMQINPHFLYNTLEAIGNAAALLMKGDNKVTDMIYSLGLLMRISLAGDNYLVSLEEELEHVRLYVKLVDFRFRERIHMDLEIPENMKNEKIVKLTLQPLIENAIEHGLAAKRSQGNVWIRGEQIGDKNYIHVIDNGEGISQEGLEQLREQLKDSAINNSRHIGLRNVDQRLKLVFGEEYGLAVKQAKEGGLCVTVCYRKL